VAVTIRQLAELVSGSVVGDEGLVIQAARILQEAQPGDITFLDSAKHAAKLQQSKASAAVVPPNVPADGKTLIQVADPILAFTAIVQCLQGRPAETPTGIHPHAFVHASARIGTDPSIHALGVVGADGTSRSRTSATSSSAPTSKSAPARLSTAPPSVRP
jgi:UDP-3-O-[3-hydroxymyristoyl] glucosamine N-acyltransferase